MNILGIETSCDECSASVVKNGKEVLSNVIVTQIEEHKLYYGVVPEIASRLHTEWIVTVVKQALEEASLSMNEIDGIAVTARPGLVGSLLVGLSFTKGLAAARGIPYIAVDHVKAHLYAPLLVEDIPYPYLGLLVSGGHTLICRVESAEDIQVMGTTIDDACGEAFDKVAKYYDFGYPGGVAIDRLAQNGDPKAFAFPKPQLKKGKHRYDVSYSGLKNAVINQIDQFNPKNSEKTPENIAASFQKTAIDLLLSRVEKAVTDSGITTVVAGGGVAANSYLRAAVAEKKDWETHFPPLKLCTDNGAMIAGLGFHSLKNGISSPFSENAFSRVVKAGSKAPKPGAKSLPKMDVDA